jgi:hypothetical protein
MREEYDRKGLPRPEEEPVREQYLRRGIAAPDLTAVKDILRFYIATSRPQIDEKPTVDSINSVAEWVFTGSTRVTGSDTDAEERSDVYIKQEKERAVART